MKDARFAVPFPMAACLDESVRQEQMRVCLRQQLPQLWPQPMDETATLHVACYGPSLADTWRDLGRPLLSMSGATDFLIARGLVPNYHLSTDPRTTALPHILSPHPDVQYLMASCSHPFTWSILKGQRVKAFHVVSGINTYAWLQVHDPKSLLVIAGSSVGLAAVQVGGVLGFRHFEIHGMDGCYHEGRRHAGPHYGHVQRPIPWTAHGRTWLTSKIMQNSNVELFNMLREWPFFVVLHGDGLVQDMMRDEDPPNGALAGTPKADLVRTARIDILGAAS